MLFTLPEQVPARPRHADARSQFLGNLTSSVADLLSTGQGTVSTACQPDISQEFMTLMEDKFIDNCSLSFYKQNLYEYEQGTAAAVVKGRLRAHSPFWVEIGAPPWVLETIRSGYVIPFATIPPGVCLSNITDRLLNIVILFPLLFAIFYKWNGIRTPYTSHGHQPSQCPLIRKGSLCSSQISVMLTAVFQKPNSEWRIGRFSSNTCRGVVTCTNSI